MALSLPSDTAWGDLTGTSVLVRVDFNCPVDDSSGTLEVSDDFRIRAALPLFNDLLERGARVVACTHFGRPNGHVVEKYSVEPIRRRLADLAPEVSLRENLRFSPGEEANSPEFGRSLIEGFDYYINEAFGASHRAHASIMFPPTRLPSAAGPNLALEVSTLTNLLENPPRPFVAVVGGAKVKDKLAVIKVLAQKADRVIVGGGMAYTFLAALGHTIGDSLVDPSFLEECRELVATGKIVLPIDSVTLPTGAAFGSGGDQAAQVVGVDIPSGNVGLDIGPDSRSEFTAVIAQAASILWNGPMGVFEDPRLSAGTAAVAHAVASSSGVSVVGGGDSVAAVTQLGLEARITFVSTGGGASLELLEKGDLPGLRALREGIIV